MAHVALVARERLLDHHALHLLERHLLDARPRAGKLQDRPHALAGQRLGLGGGRCGPAQADGRTGLAVLGLVAEMLDNFGNRVPADPAWPPGRVAINGPTGLVGVGEIAAGELQPRVVLPP